MENPHQDLETMQRNWELKVIALLSDAKKKEGNEDGQPLSVRESATARISRI